jgi:hypothetical protein
LIRISSELRLIGNRREERGKRKEERGKRREERGERKEERVKPEVGSQRSVRTRRSEDHPG